MTEEEAADHERPEPPFRLDEYTAATISFVSDAAEAVTRQLNPLIPRVRRERVEVIPRTRHEVATGEVIESEPMATRTESEFTAESGVRGDFGELHNAIFEAAENNARTIVERMVGQISELSDAVGNSVDGGGRSKWEVLPEALEAIEISFDEDGEPVLPELYQAGEVVGLDEAPDEYRAEIEAVIERKRDEWLAQRRTRRLPRDD